MAFWNVRLKCDHCGSDLPGPIFVREKCSIEFCSSCAECINDGDRNYYYKCPGCKVAYGDKRFRIDP